MNCQICDHAPINKIMSFGYMPPVNWMVPISEEPSPQTWLPTDLMHCPKCDLVQLGYIGDSNVVFPAHYPYTSGSTKLLVDNFAQQADEAIAKLSLKPGDLVIDIGSNDGTLLQAYKDRGMKVLGIEPTDIAKIANRRGIGTIQAFFNEKMIDHIPHTKGRGNTSLVTGSASLVTCCNCFAHMPDIHGVVRGIKRLLKPDGTFLSESHYLIELLRTVQYDTIYHEHLRYYSVTSLENLLRPHAMFIDDVKYIPTHGGSIRVYASMNFPQDLKKNPYLPNELKDFDIYLDAFKIDAMDARDGLLNKIKRCFDKGKQIVGIGAPSRASVVINYCRLTEDMIDYVCEREGSLKIGRYMPGTQIPVVDESRLYEDQPEVAIVFSHHIFNEIEKNLRAKGYKGELVKAIE